MDEPKTLDEVLAHYGVKGMKWGVRTNSSNSIPPSDDSKKAEVVKAKAKAGGTKSLSNQELQTLINRLNLEQQYSRLRTPSKSEKTAKFLAEVLVNVGKQQLTSLAMGQAGKLVGQLLKK